MKKLICLFLLLNLSLGFSNNLSISTILLNPEAPSCTTTSKETNNLHESDLFTTGYILRMETLPGGEVNISCELLDNKIGLVAYLYRKQPFAETPMEQNGTSQFFSSLITGQSNGTLISYAVKFVYADGVAVTKYVDYVVGTDCELETTDFQLSRSIQLSPNPAKGFINIDANQLSVAKVEFYTVLGNKVLEVKDTAKSINIENLSSGVYLVKLYMQNNKIAVKKLIME